jgi:drug/metabolite transporter (DMT)-like permease
LSTISLSLVIIAALLHAIWNLAAKKSGGTLVFAFSTSLVTVIIWSPIVCIFSYFLPQYSFEGWNSKCLIFVMLSGALHSLYYVALLHGYKVAPLSVVYPIARGVGPLISSFAAVVIFKEVLTSNTVLGIVLVVFGVFFLTWSGKAAFSHRASLKGIVWGSVTGVMISIYTIIDAYAVKTLLMHPLIFDYSTNLIRVLLLLPFVTFRLAEVRASMVKDFRSILVVAILGPSAYMLVLAAIQISPVSHVAPARELSLLLGAFLGGKFLNEGQLMRRMFAAFLIAIGVMFLSFQ